MFRQPKMWSHALQDNKTGVDFHPRPIAIVFG
jgi:hypothetical protein